eukprot:2427947-Amphidinium_carterae.1
MTKKASQPSPDGRNLLLGEFCKSALPSANDTHTHTKPPEIKELGERLPKVQDHVVALLLVKDTLVEQFWTVSNLACICLILTKTFTRRRLEVSVQSYTKSNPRTPKRLPMQ